MVVVGVLLLRVKMMVKIRRRQEKKGVGEGNRREVLLGLIRWKLQQNSFRRESASLLTQKIRLQMNIMALGVTWTYRK